MILLFNSLYYRKLYYHFESIWNGMFQDEKKIIIINGWKYC